MVPKQVQTLIVMIEPLEMTGFQAVTQNVKGKQLAVQIYNSG